MTNGLKESDNHSKSNKWLTFSTSVDLRGEGKREDQGEEGCLDAMLNLSLIEFDNFIMN